MATLAAFLRERSNPSTWLSRTRKLHLFLGNEASDADSIISSICMAFLRQRAMPAESHFCAPWVQCRRGELKVRAETEALLRCAGIDPAWLVYRDDWQLPLDPHIHGEVVLNLVDHNKLSQQGDHLHDWADDAVEAIWDHHPDLGCHKVSEQARSGGAHAVCAGLPWPAQGACGLVRLAPSLVTLGRCRARAGAAVRSSAAAGHKPLLPFH